MRDFKINLVNVLIQVHPTGIKRPMHRFGDVYKHEEATQNQFPTRDDLGQLEKMAFSIAKTSAIASAKKKNRENITLKDSFEMKVTIKIPPSSHKGSVLHSIQKQLDCLHMTYLMDSFFIV